LGGFAEGEVLEPGEGAGAGVGSSSLFQADSQEADESKQGRDGDCHQ